MPPARRATDVMASTRGSALGEAAGFRRRPSPVKRWHVLHAAYGRKVVTWRGCARGAADVPMSQFSDLLTCRGSGPTTSGVGPNGETAGTKDPGTRRGNP